MSKELTELGQWKVGQMVLVIGSMNSGYEGIKPISRITDGRGGTIYVEDKAYDIYGGLRGGDTWNKWNIQPATDADAIRIRGTNARRRIANFKWNDLDPAKAVEIEKILNDNGIITKVKI